MHSTSWLHLGSTGCLSQVGSRSSRRSSRRSRTLVCYTRRLSPPLSRRHGRSSQAYSACGTQHPMGGRARSYEIQDKYNHAGEGGRTDLRVVHGTVVTLAVVLLHVTVVFWARLHGIDLVRSSLPKRSQTFLREDTSRIEMGILQTRCLAL